MTPRTAAPKQPGVGSYVGPLVIAIVWTVGALVAAIYNWPTGVHEARIVSGDGCHGVVAPVSEPSVTQRVSDEYRNCDRSGAWTPGVVLHVKAGRVVSGQTGMVVTVSSYC